QAGFLYGPAVAGGPYYPVGLIGNITAELDFAALDEDEVTENVLDNEDVEAASNATNRQIDLSSMDGYVQLYSNEWTNTLPDGPAPGVLTNYTQDLLFSMERLANAPFSVKRLDPSLTDLIFDLEDSIVQTVLGGNSTTTLEELYTAGRLFYADHSDLASLETNGRYSAASTAYFYIDETSGEFLPLAIRTGVGSDLVYTPQDEPEDWLLAKLMFNANDVFFTQFNHLASTHMVVQIVWMAAIRSISSQHPIYAILDRITYEAFGVQPIAAAMLFASGAAVDEIFPFSGTTAQTYASNLYFNGRGDFQANYFLTDLKNRGLINSTVGPELTHFPYYEDALVIYNALEAFMTAMVDSYYAADSDIIADQELQNWATEANGPAEVIDFPASISDKATLVAVLTHIAHLVTSAHHSVNTNQLQSLSMTLPFHPASLYSPLPTTKSSSAATATTTTTVNSTNSSTSPATSVVDFLPPFASSLAQIEIGGGFSRPQFIGTSRSLINMFNDDTLLSLLNTETNTAAAAFMSTMQEFSSKVAARTFDADGLSHGMPVVWQALDPNVAPYSAAI
ncbi:lipoxygenase, partial [Coniella lustricola]